MSKSQKPGLLVLAFVHAKASVVARFDRGILATDLRAWRRSAMEGGKLTAAPKTDAILEFAGDLR